MDQYATHLAPLVKAALESDGPILELGCGDYSTPVLAEIARHNGIHLLVLTSSPEWGERFRDIATVKIIADWSMIEFSGRFGMVLLDNEQKTADRIRHLPALAKVTRCVVLHDLENCEAHAHWPDMIRDFHAVERFVRYTPATAILRC